MKYRPFNLSDACLLAGAVAVGFWINRVVWYAAFPWTQLELHWTVDYGLTLLLPHVAAMSVAVVAMRLTKPRASLRRLWRQPGAAACMVASAVLLLIVVWVATAMVAGRTVAISQDVGRVPIGGRSSGGMLNFQDVGRALTVYGDRVGFAVAGAWLYFVLAGLWRSEATWIDRLGRAVGSLWIGLTIVLWCRSLLL